MLSGQISGIPIVLGFHMTLITVLFCVALVAAFLLKEIEPKEMGGSVAVSISLGRFIFPD